VPPCFNKTTILHQENKTKQTNKQKTHTREKLENDHTCPGKGSEKTFRLILSTDTAYNNQKNKKEQT